MSTKLISQEKRINVKGFLDFIYLNCKNNNLNNVISILDELKKRKLSSEYITSLKLARLIDKQDGKIIWIYENKPTLKLVDLIIPLTTNIINKRNLKHKNKQQDRIYKFLRYVYRITKYGKPIEKDKFDISSILEKFNLKDSYKKALLDKGFLKEILILVGSVQKSVYVWAGNEPEIKSALKLYNYVNNLQQHMNKKV